MVQSKSGTAVVRPAAVAGRFYAANPAALARTVRQYLDEAKATDLPAPRAMIVPHAGYICSGIVAAASFSDARQAGAGRVHGLSDGARPLDARAWCRAVQRNCFETPLGAGTGGRGHGERACPHGRALPAGRRCPRAGALPGSRTALPANDAAGRPHRPHAVR